MGRQYDQISDQHRQFLLQQKIFFVATATDHSRINLSPKGLDTFRVLDSRRIAWLNLTGSGNETAAHLLQNPRMTVMFAAFEGKPMILRLYGTARCIHNGDSQWESLKEMFPNLPGARQIVLMDVEMVQTSCGMAVPLFQFEGQRDELLDWAEKKTPAGVKEYWAEKNQTSLDGLPTQIMDQVK